MTNTIFTVNVNNFLCDNVRESFLHAANRWGCDYTEYTTPEEKYKFLHPAFLKLKSLDLCNHERILIIDSDAIIRIDAPNIFDLTTPENFYAVRNNHSGLGSISSVDLIIAKSEIERIRAVKDIGEDDSFFEHVSRFFFNAGFQLYSRTYHSKALEYANYLYEGVNNLGWWDQMPINLAVYKTVRTYSELDFTWNRRFPPKGASKMESYVYHYAGNPERYEILKHVNWKNI